MKDCVAWIFLTQQMLNEAGASVDVAEEFINFPRSIDGVEVAILFREQRAGRWKISFRSKYDVDVQKIASVFSGGGHAHAAGCTIEGPIADVKEKVLGEVFRNL
jgi:phosphoesterase RecJ-like protein